MSTNPRRFCAILLAVLLPMGTAVAQQVPDRDAMFKKQTLFLDSRGTSQYSNSARLMPKTAWESEVPPLTRPGGNSAMRRLYMPWATAAARRYGIPENLFVRLVQQESNWDPHAQSHRGALGLAQLMPQTARELGVDPRDPQQNLDGGARYLRQQYDRFGSWKLALAAYNAGPQAVVDYGGIPPYAETTKYVSAILDG